MARTYWSAYCGDCRVLAEFDISVPRGDGATRWRGERRIAKKEGSAVELKQLRGAAVVENASTLRSKIDRGAGINIDGAGRRKRGHWSQIGVVARRRREVDGTGVDGCSAAVAVIPVQIQISRTRFGQH